MAPAFGDTEVSRHRFDTLWKYIILSDQPDMQHELMLSEAYWWWLVDNFVNYFNNNRKSMFIPPTTIHIKNIYLIHMVLANN